MVPPVIISLPLHLSLNSLFNCTSMLQFGAPFTEESVCADLWCRVTNGAVFLSAHGQVHLISTINNVFFIAQVGNGLRNKNGLQKRLCAIYITAQRELASLIERILRSLSSPFAHCPIHSTFSTPL